MADIIETEDGLTPHGNDVPWTPKTLADIEWCLERLGEALSERESIEERAHAAVAAITARRDELLGKCERRAMWFEGLVGAWAEDHRDEVVRGKVKTREFLAGSVAFRATQGKLTVTDKSVLEEWLLTQPIEAGLYRMKVEPEMKALKTLVETTGEIPAGCEWVEPSEVVKVTPAPLPTLNAPQASKVLP